MKIDDNSNVTPGVQKYEHSPTKMRRNKKSANSSELGNASAGEDAAAEHEEELSIAAAAYLKDLEAAVKDGSLSAGGRLLHMIGAFPGHCYAPTDPLLHRMSGLVQERKEFAKLKQQILQLQQQWLEKLVSGELVDIYKADEGRWYFVKLVEFVGEQHRHRNVKTAKAEGDQTLHDQILQALRCKHASMAADPGVEPDVHVHYMGWGINNDELLSLEHLLLLPQHTFTAPKRKPDSTRSSASAPPTDSKLDDGQMTAADIKTETAERRSNIRKVDGSATTPAAAVGEADSKRRRTTVASYAERAASLMVKAEKQKENEKEKDNHEWICGLCGHLEDAEDSDLVLCEGDSL